MSPSGTRATTAPTRWATSRTWSVPTPAVRTPSTSTTGTHSTASTSGSSGRTSRAGTSVSDLGTFKSGPQALRPGGTHQEIPERRERLVDGAEGPQGADRVVGDPVELCFGFVHGLGCGGKAVHLTLHCGQSGGNAAAYPCRQRGRYARRSTGVT